MGSKAPPISNRVIFHIFNFSQRHDQVPDSGSFIGRESKRKHLDRISEVFPPVEGEPMRRRRTRNIWKGKVVSLDRPDPCCSKGSTQPSARLHVSSPVTGFPGFEILCLLTEVISAAASNRFHAPRLRAEASAENNRSCTFGISVFRGFSVHVTMDKAAVSGQYTNALHP